MRRFATAVVLGLLTICWSSVAVAHQTGQSVYVAHVKTATNEVDTVTTFPAIDLVDHLGRDDGDEQVSPDEWSSNRAEVERYLASAVSVTADGTPCETIEAVAKLRSDGVAMYLHSFSCDSARVLSLRNQAMTEMATGYSHIGRIQVDDRPEMTTAFNRAFPTFEVSVGDGDKPARESIWDLLLRFIWQGIVHILLGLDHVLFVLALVLISRDLKRLLGVITAFTVSHSVTLGLATLGVVRVPASVVEPLIAASILYVAIEAWWREDEPRYIYATTFALGLLHGFGFSYVLADVGLPQDSVVPALFAFNVGVELGQVGVIVALWPLRRWMRDKPWERRAVRVCAALLGLVALFWLVERTLL